MWWNLPYIPTQPTIVDPVQSPLVFRSGVDCPIPREWIIASAIVGLAIGYLIWGVRS